MDEAIGTVVKALEENKMTDNTIIIFASDVEKLLSREIMHSLQRYIWGCSM